MGLTVHREFLWMMGGILGLLTVASLIGALLAWRVTSDKGRTVVTNLNQRIKAWWIMVAVLSVCFWSGEAVTLVFFALVSFFALREFMSLVPTRRGDYLTLCLCFYLAIPLQYTLIGIQWYGLFAILIPVYGFLLLPSLAAAAGDTDHFLARCAKVQWGLLLTVYCVSYVPALLLLNIPNYHGQGLMLMLFLLLVVQLSDVLQYVFGKLFGRHLLAPKVSPSKTVEGLVGGGVSATLIGGCLHGITPFSFVGALALSAMIVACGFLGGLALSAVKRSLGAKDWGTLIEGHGGILDRLDSVCFAAPIFFHVVRYLYT
jgi:phosphatidate cytidylyltransferase